MKISKLKNTYTGEVVYCRDLSKTVAGGGDMIFVKVYHPENPEREYLVNRSAFDVVE